MAATIRLMKFGSYIEKIGTYNPHTEPKTLIIDDVKLSGWLKKGAQVSEGIHKLLKNRKAQ